MDQYIGRLLDNRYEILELIGTGGMAYVYKARCHRLNRLVALKILKDEFSRDEEFRRRFRAEGEAVAMLSHPNIVQVYDVSSSDNANYIVMELIDGISLKQYMEKKGVLNWKETLHFSMQIAKGLDHAHSKGIVHRDIKPHNVMVLKNGSVKVMDFGIARVMSKSNTLTKEALGSVHYISPEQAKGSWVDNRSDLYSLSVVMYEMMTGRPPYDGESPVAVAIKHINGGAPMPSQLNPNIPGGLEQIIMKGMALELKDRYASAGDMLKDMEEFRKNPMLIFPWGHPKSGAAASRSPVSTVPNSTARRKTAQGSRTATGGTAAVPQARRRQEPVRKPQRPEEDAEEKRSRMTTIAIVACSAVAVIAIIIFLFALLSGGFFKTELVEVPDLLGKTYYTDMAFDDLIIKAEHSYNSDYPKGTIFGQTPSGGSDVAKGAIIKVSVSMGSEPEVKYMENLVGQTSEAAMAFLKSQGMNPLQYTEFSDDFAEGEVIRTEPAANEELIDGQTVKIYVSSGPMIKTAQMPNLVGMNMDDAMQLLDDLGFKDWVYEYVESSEPRGEVVSQSLDKYTEVDVTTRIVLLISKGPAETTEPATEPATEAPTEAVTEKVTEEPTEETTQETTEETTEAEEEDVTKTVSILLPQREESFLVSIYCNGQAIRESTSVSAGTTSITIEVTGSGTVTYDIYINGEYYASQEVVFSE